MARGCLIYVAADQGGGGGGVQEVSISMSVRLPTTVSWLKNVIRADFNNCLPSLLEKTVSKSGHDARRVRSESGRVDWKSIYPVLKSRRAEEI